MALVPTLLPARRNWQITAIPANGAGGAAPLLVALGDAGIAVTRAQVKNYAGNAYVLTVDEPERAMDVLHAIGCDIQRLSPGSEANPIFELVTFASEIRIDPI
jgi:hypothetical protein